MLGKLGCVNGLLPQAHVGEGSVGAASYRSPPCNINGGTPSSVLARWRTEWKGVGVSRNSKPRVLLAASLAVSSIALFPGTAIAQAFNATLGDASFARAAAFNIHGQVVSNGTEWYDGVRLWSSDGSSVVLPKLPGTQNYLSSGAGINDAGVVVGYNQASNARIPFSWSQSGGLQDLSSAIGGYIPVSINNHGQIVGNLQGSSCLWDPIQGFQLLPVSNVVGINDSGVIIGNDFSGASANAYVWTANGGLQWLFPPTGPGGSVRGINNAGQVVGFKDAGAFIWDHILGLRDLNGLVTLPQNEMLTDPITINNMGQIMVQGTSANYLLTPVAVPEGSTWTAVCVLGGSVRFLRSRRSFRDSDGNARDGLVQS